MNHNFGEILHFFSSGGIQDTSRECKFSGIQLIQMISISSFSPTPDMPPKFPSLDFTQLGFNAILACSLKVSESIQDNLLCKQDSYFEEMISNVWINVCHNNFATVSSMNKTLGSNKLNLDSNPTSRFFQRFLSYESTEHAEQLIGKCMVCILSVLSTANNKQRTNSVQERNFTPCWAIVWREPKQILKSVCVFTTVQRSPI